MVTPSRAHGLSKHILLLLAEAFPRFFHSCFPIRLAIASAFCDDLTTIDFITETQYNHGRAQQELRDAAAARGVSLHRRMQK